MKASLPPTLVSSTDNLDFTGGGAGGVLGKEAAGDVLSQGLVCITEVPSSEPHPPLLESTQIPISWVSSQLTG